MEKKRPQLNPDELLRLKWLLGGLLVLLSVSTVLYLEIDAWLLMALTVAGVLAGLVRPAWPARLPAMVHRLAFPAIVAIFIGDIYLTTEVLPALVRLDILLLLYRGITYRQRRDDLQIIVLGLFLIVLAGVLTVSLLFAVQILAFVACSLVFLLVITLVQAAGDTPRYDTPRPLGTPLKRGFSGTPFAMTRPGASRHSSPSFAKPSEGRQEGIADTPRHSVPTWTQGTWRHLFGRVRAATDWRMVLLGGGLFAGLVVVSGLLFLAIPRFELQNSLFLERFMTKKARTGFSDHIKFGDVTDIQQDDGVAVSVDISDPKALPAQPYWRMVVLDEYRQESFRLSPMLRHTAFSREHSEAYLRGAARPRLGPPVYWTFYLEAGVSRYLPLAGAFDLLRFRDRQHFRVARALGVVALRNEPVSMTAYRVEGTLPGGALSDLDFALRWQQARTDGREARLTQLQVGLPTEDRAQLHRIATEITGGEQLAAAEFARRASAWLAANHDYGLQSRTPEGTGDPLVRWMDSREPGHCELFAGALVLLARETGLPARIVTGFKGGSWNGFSNNLTLRNSDAHAWCEIYDAASRSWLRADPTPGAQVVSDLTRNAGLAEQNRRIDRSWSARLDSLRIFWYRRIVNFDQRSQVETFKAVKSATQETGRRIRVWLAGLGEQVKAWLVTPWDFRRIGLWIVVLAGVSAVLWGSRRLSAQWWRLRRRRKGRLHPVRVEAGRWLQRLHGRSPEAMLWGNLQRLRFGDEDSWAQPEAIFRQARREWRVAKRRGSGMVEKRRG